MKLIVETWFTRPGQSKFSWRMCHFVQRNFLTLIGWLSVGLLATFLRRPVERLSVHKSTGTKTRTGHLKTRKFACGASTMNSPPSLVLFGHWLNFIPADEGGIEGHKEPRGLCLSSMAKMFVLALRWTGNIGQLEKIVIPATLSRNKKISLAVGQWQRFSMKLSVIFRTNWIKSTPIDTSFRVVSEIFWAQIDSAKRYRPKLNYTAHLHICRWRRHRVTAAATSCSHGRVWWPSSWPICPWAPTCSWLSNPANQEAGRTSTWPAPVNRNTKPRKQAKQPPKSARIMSWIVFGTSRKISTSSTKITGPVWPRRKSFASVTRSTRRPWTSVPAIVKRWRWRNRLPRRLTAGTIRQLSSTHWPSQRLWVGQKNGIWTSFHKL